MENHEHATAAAKPLIDHFTSVPHELIGSVLESLSVMDLLRVRHVNCRLRAVVQDRSTAISKEIRLKERQRIINSVRPISLVKLPLAEAARVFFHRDGALPNIWCYGRYCDCLTVQHICDNDLDDARLSYYRRVFEALMYVNIDCHPIIPADKKYEKIVIHREFPRTSIEFWIQSLVARKLCPDRELRNVTGC